MANIREKYRTIQQKYARSHIKINKQDQKMLNALKKQEKSLSLKNEKLSFIENNFGTLCNPFFLLIQESLMQHL